MIFLAVFGFGGAGSVTLRIRLPSGATQRLVVDEQEETVESLRIKIVGQGWVPHNSNMTVKGLLYATEDGQKNQTRLSDIGLSQGEIVTVISPASSDASPTFAKSKAAGAKQAEKYGDAAATPAATSTGGVKRAASLAELQRLRKEMIKVTRQKSTGKRAVAVSSSAARILNRLSKGGVALLLGRNMTEPAAAGAASSGSKTRVMSSGSNDKNAARRECIEVHAACEIFAGTSLPDDLIASAAVDAISLSVLKDIATNLGLKIVGCAIGVPGKTDKDPPCLWSPQHVAAALQLKTLASGPFVVLSAGSDKGSTTKAKAASTGGKLKPAASKGGKATPKKKTLIQRKGGGVDAAVRAATKGLALEAFELSDQALLMQQRQILPNKLLPLAGSKKSKGGASKGKKTGSPSSSSSSSSSDKVVEKIALSSPVLVSNGEEALEIDPYLLAVPMPIVALGMGSAAPRKPKGIVTAKTASSPPWRPPALGIDFEHSFPSVFELRNPTELKRAGKHVLQVLGGATRPAMVARMRDVQLLLHFSKLLDPDTLRALCESLAKPCERLPPAVLMAMEMAKLSMSSTEAEADL